MKERKITMVDARYTWLLLFTYTLFFTINMFVAQHCSPDTFYYWQWSQHLDWSYYDGPPMIAYAFRVITMIFGSSITALLSLGLLAEIITSYFVYKIAKLLFDNEKIAFISLAFWLLTVGDLRYFFILVTYDTVLIIFWALSFYCYVKLLLTHRVRYYYFTAISIGLMLLSKYTGILLCGSMLITSFCYAPYRFIFKSKHFYFSLLVICSVFSPVLYWNYEHQWISFIFQLNHGLSNKLIGLDGIRTYFVNTLIDINISFLLLVVMFFKQFRAIFKNPTLGLLIVPTVLVWTFFFMTSFRSIPLPQWNGCFFFAGSILLGYYVVDWRWSVYSVVLCFVSMLIVCILYVILCCYTNVNPNSWTVVTNPKLAKLIISQFPKKVYDHKILYSVDSYDINAYSNYFLSGHPSVYSTNTLALAHQDYFWTLHDHPAHSGDLVSLISQYKTPTDKHFTDCQMAFHATASIQDYFHKVIKGELYVLSCRYKELLSS